MIAYYTDPLAEFFPPTYGTTRPVFVPLPKLALTLVPAALLHDEGHEDQTPVDPRSWDDIPLQAEPEDFRASYLMALALAANDDWPEPYDPAHHDANVEPPPTVTAVPVNERRKQDGAPRAKPSGRRKLPEGKPLEPLALNVGLQATGKMKYLRTVARDRDLSDRAKAVAIPLADHVNGEEGHAWISMETLGAEVGKGWQAAQRAVNDLLAAGYIRLKQTGRACHITLVLDRQPLAEMSKPTPQKRRAAEDGEEVPEGRDVRADTPRGVRADIAEMSDMTPYSEINPATLPRERGKPENEAVAASATPPPVRSHLSFDEGWPVFKKAWPVLLDDRWRPAFIGARRDGWSLQQLLAGILYVQAALPDGAVMVNIGRFFGQQMWITSPDDQPDHHCVQHEPSKFSWPEDDDSSGIPF